jgi:hypothetical protein
LTRSRFSMTFSRSVKPAAAIAQGIKAFLIVSVCACTMLSSHDLTAEAKKKAAEADPAAAAEEALKKEVGPLSDKIKAFMVKEESRLLLSPKEAGELADLKFKLMDLMNDNPQNPLLAKPLYQGAVLLSLREEFNDAYNLFLSVSQNYPTTPYGMKAKGHIAQLVKRFGADYFAVETAASTPGTAATPSEAGTTASTATTPAATTEKK